VNHLGKCTRRHVLSERYPKSKAGLAHLTLLYAGDSRPVHVFEAESRPPLCPNSLRVTEVAYIQEYHGSVGAIDHSWPRISATSLFGRASTALVMTVA
jgi:hypothetical protein